MGGHRVFLEGRRELGGGVDWWALRLITKALPLSLTSFAPESTARERRAGNP